LPEALRGWLPTVLQAVKPYMSKQANEAGVRWEVIVCTELNATDFGLICLTPSLSCCACRLRSGYG
jgi:hypothetical protein